MADLVQSGFQTDPEADRHLAHLLAAEPEPWFKSLIRNVKETINPPKLPPLEVTSKPVAVKDIWAVRAGQEVLPHVDHLPGGCGGISFHGRVESRRPGKDE